MESKSSDVAVINESICLNQVIGEETNQISLDEETSLSNSLEKIIYVEIIVPQHKIEVNVLNDKVSIEGKLTRIVYGISLEGEFAEEVLPEQHFSHFIHLQGIKPTDSALVDVNVGDYKGRLKGNDVLQEEVNLDIFVKVTAAKSVDVFKDIGEDINQTKELTRLQNLVEQKELEVPAEVDVGFEQKVLEIIETETKVIPQSFKVADNKGEIEATILYRIAYKTEDDKISEVKGREEFNKKLDLSNVDSSMEMWADLKVTQVENQLNDTKLQVTQTITINCNVKVFEISQMELVTEAEGVDTYDDQHTIENVVCQERESIKSQQSAEFSISVDKIERITTNCKIKENKVLDDKVSLNLSVIHLVHYKDEDGKKHLLKVTGEEVNHFIYIAGVTEDMKALVKTDISDVKIELTPDSMAATISCHVNVLAKILHNEQLALVTDVNVLKDKNHDASVIIYSVQDGDTLFKIAKRFGVRQKRIISTNKEYIKDPSHLEIGQKIIIPCN
ncbi:SPOCS domain-containing protein [Proteinivorax tanatarense]|uniref:SPOCS domain-containing protein n=1 Tax=Proteinivorax tanatarense TaxID=1260629 RepID=A0AAU7VLQ7_9FIRM